MDDIARFVNSPLGLLLVGSLVSGLIVQFIVSRWQRQNWIFQQQFTDRKARTDKRLEAQYALLEAINRAVAKILTQSQNVAVGEIKAFAPEQMAEVIRTYNEAVDEWEMNARGFRIQLQVYFRTEVLIKQWDAIKQQRDELDVAIYQVGMGEKTPDECLQRINALSEAVEKLSRMMYEEINRQEEQRL
jgi:hypothetical protein